MTAALCKRLLYLIATVTSVAIVFLMFYLPEGVWLLVTALLFLNISLDTTLARRSLIIAAAGTVSVTLIYIGTLAAPYVLAQIVIHSVITACCVYAGALRGKSAYPWFAVNFLGVLSINTDGTMMAAFSHAQAALISVVLVMLWQLVLLPFFNRDEYRRVRAHLFKDLLWLMTDIIDCLRAPEYPDNVYLFERRIHKQKIKCLNHMALLAERESVMPNAKGVAREMQTLYQIIIDVGQIRRRVTDHTIFAICSDELTEVDVAVSTLFAELAGKSRADYLLRYQEGLESAIMRFETSFEHILRVTAREPLVFVLMLNALQSLARQCRRLADLPHRIVEAQA